MRRGLIAAVGTTAGLVALLGYRSSGSTAPHRVSLSAGGSSTTTAVPPASPSPAGASPAATGAPTTSGARRTAVGQLVQYFYGDIQVSVTLDNGKITSVTAPQNGAADARSQMINSYAIPILEKEAVAAQGLNFNAVSGATFTSNAFAQSLQSALQKVGK